MYRAARFQLTPPRGGDHRPTYHRSKSPCFNSRPREGATCFCEWASGGNCVSTHAPARGRRCKSASFVGVVLFQLTPPRGGDLNLLVGHDVPPCFNSRPREGATRRGELRIEALGPVSTHAPARGRRIGGYARYLMHLVSTHAPARGRRLTPGSCGVILSLVSTHAPARGRLEV